MEIVIDDIKYKIVKNVNDCFKEDEFTYLFTDYFYDFDYILGDYSYDKLRLKGFCDKNNSRYSKINDITTLDDYVENYCSYKANYFLLKKVK